MKLPSLYISVFCLVCVFKAGLSRNPKEPRDVECDENFEKFLAEAFSKDGKLVRCDACLLEDCYVIGVDMYSPYSSICCSAIHDGKIGPEGGLVIIKKMKHPRLRKRIQGTFQHNISSHDYDTYHYSYTIESVEATTTPVPTTTTAPPTTTTPVTTEAPETPSPAATSPDVAASARNEMAAEDNDDYEAVAEPNGPSEGESPKSNEAEPRESLHLPSDTATAGPGPSLETTPSTATINLPTWLVYLVGAVVSAMVIALVAFGVLKASRRVSSTGLWSRLPSRKRSNNPDFEGCVCYVAMESSQQGLLHDPETCERTCSKKKQLMAGVYDDPSSSQPPIIEDLAAADSDAAACNNVCEDCTGGCGGNDERFAF